MHSSVFFLLGDDAVGLSLVDQVSIQGLSLLVEMVIQYP